MKTKLLLAALLALGTLGCSDDTTAGPDTGADGAAADMTPDLGQENDASVPGAWIAVKAGAFNMGSPASEGCRDSDEDARKVTLGKGFQISATEVTQQQFEKVMGYNPSFHKACGKDCPVEWVSWHEAAAYCNGLSALRSVARCYSCTGAKDAVRCTPAGAPYACVGFRLPTEAEWEYAARAGTTTPFHGGAISSCMTTDATAGATGWYKVNSSGTTHPVGKKQKNAWGLHDMVGNVYEWTNDWYESTRSGKTADPAGPASGTEKIFRGGAWYYNAEHARSANRERFAPTKPFTFVGFRCVRSCGMPNCAGEKAEAPAWQGVRRALALRQVTDERRSQAGWIGLRSARFGMEQRPGGAK